MGKKNNLGTAFKKTASKVKEKSTSTPKANKVGKKPYTIFVEPTGVKQLDLLALERDDHFKNRNAVIEEALNDVLEKYGKQRVF